MERQVPNLIADLARVADLIDQQQIIDDAAHERITPNQQQAWHRQAVCDTVPCMRGKCAEVSRDHNPIVVSRPRKHRLVGYATQRDVNGAYKIE